jgi:acyl-CoA reductase-like NAD-dependent aldehyde dehydrogenase
MKAPIEKTSMRELLKEWQAELNHLQAMEQANPTWEWKPVQERLERLHALAHELRKRRAEDRAKWQP